MIALIEGRRMKRYKLASDFASTVAKHGIGMNEIADAAGISRATLYGLQNPAIHPNRRGGMRLTTLWKIAHAFAEKTKMSPEAAKDLLFVEEEVEEEAGE